MNSRPRHQRELEKSIRTMIRLKFSVEADRAIEDELTKFRQSLSDGTTYTFNIDKVLEGVGQPQASNVLPR